MDPASREMHVERGSCHGQNLTSTSTRSIYRDVGVSGLTGTRSDGDGTGLTDAWPAATRCWWSPSTAHDTACSWRLSLPGWMVDYTAKVKVIVKVLNFVQFGGDGGNRTGVQQIEPERDCKLPSIACHAFPIHSVTLVRSATPAP